MAGVRSNTVETIEGVRVRTANPAERLQLEALQMRAAMANAGDASQLSAHPEAVHVPDALLRAGRVRVAEAANAIVGFAVLLPVASGACELDGLFVAPEVWRRGVGRALLEACLSQARLERARCIHATVNSHAAGFYLANGFTHVRWVETEFGPASEMRVLI